MEINLRNISNIDELASNVENQIDWNTQDVWFVVTVIGYSNSLVYRKEEDGLYLYDLDNYFKEGYNDNYSLFDGMQIEDIEEVEIRDRSELDEILKEEEFKDM